MQIQLKNNAKKSMIILQKDYLLLNPKSQCPINYDSPITQKILRICYKKYKMTKLPAVIDPRNLFGNTTPPQLSPASSPSPTASPLASPSGSQSAAKKQSRSASPLRSSSSSYGPPGTPSPPSSLPSSPLPPPSPKIKKHSRTGPKIKKQTPPSSPPAARKQTPPSSPPAARKQTPPGSPPAARKQSPPKPKLKLNFEGVSDKTVDKKKYANLSYIDCNSFIKQCKDVLEKQEQEKSSKVNRQQIINPKTNQKIYTDSPITKYLLFTCYYHNNIKDVEDIAEIDTLCNKPPAIKNNYNAILTKCKDLKLNYTESNLDNLFVETELDVKYLPYFKNYIISCKQIEKKQTIDFDTVCKHFEIIFNLLNDGSKSTIAFV